MPPFLQAWKDRLTPPARRKSFGLDGLDLKLARHIFKRGGFFVEAGANDGIRQSNTLYFEKYLGWRGLLVEPVPENAALAVRNRPRCWVECTALVAPDYESSTLELRYFDLMTYSPGAIQAGEMRLKHEKKAGQYVPESGVGKVLEVPAITLGALLRKLGVKHVDLLSLDVEGYEAEVLRGLDFTEIRPEWLLVEVREAEKIEAVLRGHYATVAELTRNDTHRDILYHVLSS